MKTHRRFPRAQNIEPPIFKAFNLDDSRRNTDAMNRFFTLLFGVFAQQDKTKNVLLVDAAADHEFVPLFEDMKRNGDLWKKNEVR